MRKLISFVLLAALAGCADANGDVCLVPGGSKTANFDADVAVGAVVLGGAITAATLGAGAPVATALLSGVGALGGGAGLGAAYSGEVPCGK